MRALPWMRRALGDLVSRRRTRAALGSDRPILVYTVGKTGSSSVYESLASLGLPVLHLHYARFDHQRLRSRRLFDYLVVEGGPCDVITMVRRPFERNESSFIESLPRYLSPREIRDLQSGRQLVEPYLDRFDHFEVCTWLDRELQRTTGLDAYEAGETGPGTYRLDRNDRRLLVLSSHAPSERQAAVLADFLGLENVPVRRANVTSEGGFRRIYREFREAVRYPDALRIRIQEMRYSRHFQRDFRRVPESL